MGIYSKNLAESIRSNIFECFSGKTHKRKIGIHKIVFYSINFRLLSEKIDNKKSNI